MLSHVLTSFSFSKIYTGQGVEPKTGLDMKMDKTMKIIYKGRVHLKIIILSKIISNPFVDIFSVEHKSRHIWTELAFSI